MKIRAEYTKLGQIKFISHLDLLRLFARAFHRGEVPILYSEGFNPHPLFTLGNPLSLGVESESEFLELELPEDYDASLFQDAMNRVLPEGVRIRSVLTEFSPVAIQKRIHSMEYSFTWEGDGRKVEEVLDRFLREEEIVIHRLRKRGKRKVEVAENAAPLILGGRVEGDVVLYGHLSSEEGSHLRPDTFLKAFLNYGGFDMDPDLVEIKRVKNYDETGSEFHGR